MLAAGRHGRSVCTIPAQKMGDGLEQNLQVEGQRPVLDVVDVEQA